MTLNLTFMTAAQQAEGLSSGKFTSVQLVNAYLERIEKIDETINAFLHINSSEALRSAESVDLDRKAGIDLPPLAGIPVAIKDIIVTKNQPTTAASQILKGWISPYDATVITKLRNNRMPILGKTNLDEFALGSSTEHSAYAVTRNPWDIERIPGGSSGGSAAAVAAYEAPFSLGTDTGGSIRQPAALTGIVGVKPTYGTVSRYGSIALASSLDQIGPMARNVLDAALLHNAILGYDPKDSTSIHSSRTHSLIDAAKEKYIKNMRIGVIKELNGDDYQKDVKNNFNSCINILKDLNANIVEVSCPNFQHALGAYYLIMSSEISSNLARFDSIRYGKRAKIPNKSIGDIVAESRELGLGNEVKRRIILGTYALSSNSYDEYYASAQKIRALIQEDFHAAFQSVDVLISPTSPTTAFKINEKMNNPLAMYKNDIATIPASLAGIPGMSLPNGLSKEEGLPTGIQILSPAKEDYLLYKVGSVLEKALQEKWGHTFLLKPQQLLTEKVHSSDK